MASTDLMDLHQEDREAPIHIDGSVLEGGGQILRITTALAAILQKSVRISKIRAGRKNPGLSNQHLHGLELIKELSHESILKDAKIGSEDIAFFPGKLLAGSYIGDSVTAGSVGLLLQIALPCAIFATGPVTLTLRGGTNADFAPPIDYVQQVLLPILKRMGVQADLKVLRRGFFPRGGGEVIVHIQPVKFLQPITLSTRGSIQQIHIFSYVAGQVPDKIAHECASMAEENLRDITQSGSVKVVKTSKRIPEVEAVGTGTGIFIWAETNEHCIFGGNSNGAKGKRNNVVAREACDMLVAAVRSGACVDEHLEDQLIISMALAKGCSSVLCGPLSLHTKTAIFVCESILGVRFLVTEKGDGLNLIECEGIGFENGSL